MGITIAYRGRLPDLTRIEDFEDRLLDLALEMGGQAKIWRSRADDNPQRVVRGVILDLAPGQETTSLLVSPEGWLIGLVDIEDAENGRLTEPPWCFTKTQFGPLEAHVALIEMFTALRREFIPDLELSDEGGYYPTSDLAELTRRHSATQKAIDSLAEGLRRHGLSHEAAEDPDIVLRHIERVAAQVHRILRRPAEHPPVTFPENEVSGIVPDPQTTKALWDDLFKHNRRQQERLHRALEERRSRGEKDETAFDKALEDLGLEVPGEESGADEPWQEEESFGEAGLEEVASEDAREDPFAAEEDRHPLLQRAMDLLRDLHNAFQKADPQLESSLQALFQGAGDMMGGLAQALSWRKGEDEDLDLYGLKVVQLKRALRGAAFARGALFPLRSAVTAEQFDELYRSLGQMEQDIFHELGRVRSERRGEDS